MAGAERKGLGDPAAGLGLVAPRLGMPGAGDERHVTEQAAAHGFGNPLCGPDMPRCAGVVSTRDPQQAIREMAQAARKHRA